MDRALSELPFEREPRSAGYPPLRHSRQSDPSQPFPPRYSDPGPTVAAHYRGRTGFDRNYSVASTVSSLSSNSSSNSSLFGNSYSMSSGSSVADDGYLSPPSSRRTSEATKLPSIHELEKNMPSPIELLSTSSSPQKRGSLATITEETPAPHHERLPFPPEYPGSTIVAIPKARSNSYPPSNNNSYPPPPPSFPNSPSQHFQPETHSKRIAQVLDFNHTMSRVIRDLEMIRDESRQLHDFASRYKDSLQRALQQGSEQIEIPPEEIMNDQLGHLEQINMSLRAINAHRMSFRSPNYVKHEEDTRMHDIVTSSKYYNEGYHPGVHPMYHESISPSEQYWSHGEGGRSKYKKRSRAAPPGRCHSCNIESTPEWRRGPDGARTLCNACGLHYAKVSKRSQREGGHHQSDEMTNGHNPRQDNRQ